MNHVSTLAVAIIILLSAPWQGHRLREAPALRPSLQHDTVHDQPKTDALPGVVVDPETTELEELADWAVGRFALAGLILPDVEIHFHEDDAGCMGYHGLHTEQLSGSRIDICARGYVVQVRTVLHELGHAFVSRGFPSERRDEFLALRGLDVWHDDVTRWNMRGFEHAAEIIAWGVSEEARLPGRIADHDLGSVTEAYELLTGRSPISATIVDDHPPREAPGGLQP